MNGSSTSCSSDWSPSRLSRIQETEEMQTLNDRFANYIEKARNLEAEKLKLENDLANATEVHKQEFANLKIVFESQLQTTENRLTESEAQNAKLEIDVKKWKAEAEALGVKFGRVEADNAMLTKKLASAESEVASLTERLNAALSEKAAAVEECGAWRVKFGEAEKQLAATRVQLEDGIMAKATLENQLRAATEELEFKTNVLQVDSSSLSVSTLISSEASVNIELKLQESLQGLREHYDARAAALKAELQAMYKAQLQGLSVASESSLIFETGSEGELAAKDVRISELLLQINDLKGKLQMSQGKFAAMEKEMAGRDAKHAAALALKEKQIGELQSQVGEFMGKYNDLKNLHLAMEVEVEAYGQLLANEETRLKIAADQQKAAGKKNLQQELRQLNDRFAFYIEENLKNLAAEKVQLTMELQSIEVKHQQQLATITGNYEVRLAETQKLLDDATKLKTHFEVEVQKLKDQVKDLSAKLREKQTEATTFEAQLRTTERDLAALTAKYEALLKEKQAALDALAKYKLELSELKMSFASATRELEAANLAKVNLEAEIASFQRDSQMSKSMYDAELKELRLKTEIEISEMDDSALIESDTRLEKSLQELRRPFGQEADDLMLAMRRKYEGTISELEGKLRAQASVGVKTTQVTVSSDAQLKALKLQVEDLKQKLKMADGRYVTLQKAMQAKETAFQSALAAKDADLQRIQAQLSEKLLELRELMNLKLTMDLELAAYDKMLIAEEEMFGVQVQGDGKPSPVKKTDTLVKGYSKGVRLLKTLNDRFATYVELVQKLRSANQLLEVRVQKVEENATREIASLKGLYEAELADARVLIDQTAKEKAQMQIEVGKWKSQVDELAVELATLKSEVAGLKKSLKAAEAKIADLTNKLAAALKDRQEAMDALAALKLKFGDLEVQLQQARKQLEQETVVRVDLENRLQSIKEELVFKKSLFDAELNQSRSKLDLSMEITAPEPKESKIHEYLRDLRQQNDSQSSALRAELMAVFESQCGGLTEATPAPTTTTISDAEIAARLEITELNTTIGDLNAQLMAMTGRLAAVEAEAAAAEAALKGVIDEKEGMIGELREKLKKQLAEFSELSNLKLKLDLEIAAYRKLLEGEEERLNTSRSPTPTRGMKRKRASHVITASSSSISTAASVEKAIEAAATASDDADHQLQTKTVKLTAAAAPVVAAASPVVAAAFPVVAAASPAARSAASKTSSVSFSLSPSSSTSKTTTTTTRRILSSGSTPTSGATSALADSSAAATSSSSSSASYSYGGGRKKTVIHKTVVRQEDAVDAEANNAEENKGCVLM